MLKTAILSSDLGYSSIEASGLKRSGSILAAVLYGPDRAEELHGRVGKGDAVELALAFPPVIGGQAGLWRTTLSEASISEWRTSAGPFFSMRPFRSTLPDWY